MIIVFSGSDGAGKSTQIERLIQRLDAKSKCPKYLWSRGGYTPVMVAAKQIVLRMMGRRNVRTLDPKNNEDYLQKRAKTISQPLVARMYLVVSTLDLALLYGLYVRLLSLFGCTMICDRYVVDSRIDFERNFPDSFDKYGPLWRALQCLAPEPDVHFVLTVPVDVSLQRSAQKNEPFPDTPETLDFRLQRYQAPDLLDRPNVVRLDGTQSIEAVAAQIDEAIRTVGKGGATT